MIGKPAGGPDRQADEREEGPVRTLVRYLGGVVLVGPLVVTGTWVRVGQIGDRDERAAADAIVLFYRVVGGSSGISAPVF